MIDPSNPMNLFNKTAPPDQVQALRQLFLLLGGLGQNQGPIITQPQPQPETMKPILGGLAGA